MTKIQIVNYNPLEHSEVENKAFAESYKEIFNQNDHMKYLSYSGIEYTDKQYKQWNAEFNPDEKVYLNAMLDGKIVGFAIIMVDTCTLFDIFGLCIHEQYKRRGIGKKLLSKAYDLAKRKKFKSVQIEVFADNRPMLCNVINEGFKPIKIDYHKRYDGEDILILKKYF